MNEKTKIYGARFLILAYALLGIGTCEKLFSRSDTRPYADATSVVSESPRLPYLHHESMDGLYLTVTENQDKKRQINFFDYGFDGKLDRIRVNQNERREIVITNKTELTEWQPVFEKFRERRFGNYTNSLDYKMEFKN
jgi:hypothetical protein